MNHHRNSETRKFAFLFVNIFGYRRVLPEIFFSAYAHWNMLTGRHCPLPPLLTSRSLATNLAEFTVHSLQTKYPYSTPKSADIGSRNGTSRWSFRQVGVTLIYRTRWQEDSMSGSSWTDIVKIDLSVSDVDRWDVPYQYPMSAEIRERTNADFGSMAPYTIWDPKFFEFDFRW